MRNLQPSNFDEAIAGDKMMVIDFWADWCMPCRMMAPVVAEAAQAMGDRADFAKVDIEAYPELAARYDIDTIPTLILFRQGAEVGRTIGLKPKDQLLQEIEAAL